MNKQFQMYPKWKYQEGEAPRLVQTHTEEANLGDGWFDKPDGTNHAFNQAEAAMSEVPPGYVPEEYPKWLYAPERPGGVLVHNAMEEDALDDDITWYDKPDFTMHGEDSTDTTGLVSTSSVKNPPFDAIGGPNVLKPVPEMQQGAARTRASNNAEMDANADDTDEEVNDGEETDEDGNDVNDEAGEPLNDFDQANGENPGDAAPAGENPNGPTGKITKPGIEKATAETVKATANAKKKKSADDLL